MLLELLEDRKLVNRCKLGVAARVLFAIFFGSFQKRRDEFDVNEVAVMERETPVPRSKDMLVVGDVGDIGGTPCAMGVGLGGSRPGEVGDINRRYVLSASVRLQRRTLRE